MNIELPDTITIHDVKHQGDALTEKGVFENGEIEFSLAALTPLHIISALAFSVRQGSGDAPAGLKKGKGKNIPEKETVDAFQKRQKAVVLDKLRRIEAGTLILRNDPTAQSEDPIVVALLADWAVGSINPATGKAYTKAALTVEISKRGAYRRLLVRGIAAKNKIAVGEVLDIQVEEAVEKNSAIYATKYAEMQEEMAKAAARAKESPGLSF